MRIANDLYKFAMRISHVDNHYRPGLHIGPKYGRGVIKEMVLSYVRDIGCHYGKLLDVGCGDATDLRNLSRSLKHMSLYGVDIDLNRIDTKLVDGRSINVARVNLEYGKLPYENSFFDIIISNQTLEHTKNYLWALNEMLKVLKLEGLLVIGVPNLASLHNRILLLFGKHPTSINMTGTYVRGFTVWRLKRVLEYSTTICKVRGSEFYPLPPRISKVLSKSLPSSSVSIFLSAIKKSDREIINLSTDLFYGEDIIPEVYEALGKNDVYIQKMPQFLRTVREVDLTCEEWDRLIELVRARTLK